MLTANLVFLRYNDCLKRFLTPTLSALLLVIVCAHVSFNVAPKKHDK